MVSEAIPSVKESHSFYYEVLDYVSQNRVYIITG